MLLGFPISLNQNGADQVSGWTVTDHCTFPCVYGLSLFPFTLLPAAYASYLPLRCPHLFCDVLSVLKYPKCLAFSGQEAIQLGGWTCSGWTSKGGGWKLLGQSTSVSCLSSTSGNLLFHGVLILIAPMWCRGDEFKPLFGEPGLHN